jgi:sugar phosphate permease
MDQGLEAQTMRRVFTRLIPLLFAMMFFNYLDRINIGFAALRMNHDLGFSPGVFGFGASIFFLGYMLVEIPSNLILHRVGARKWLARILLTWGAVAALTAFVWSEGSFFVLRLGLGVMEAGFLPGVAMYLTYWFPERYRARAVTGYIVAGSVAAILGGPISTTIMTYLDGPLGLHGWQWMFIAEGVPTMLLGLFVLAAMTERPADAGWLTPQQRAWLQQTLDQEGAFLTREGRHRLADVISDPRVWTLAAMFGCALVGIYGMFMWLPQIIKELGTLSDIQVGFLSAIPPLLSVLGTVVIGRSSDRTGDRKYHLSFVYGMSALALAGSALAPTPVIAFACLCVTGFFIFSGNPLFWSLAASFMTGAAGAMAIALINTTAQIGGLVGPWSIGLVRGATGSFTAALLAIAAFLVAASLIAFLMPVKLRPRAQAAALGRMSPTPRAR